MSVAFPMILLNEITDFLASNPTPEEITTFTPSEGLQNRALELLRYNRENQLTPEQRAEMEDFMRMEHFMTILKAKSR